MLWSLHTVEKPWAFNSTVTGWVHHREHREHGEALWSLRTVEKPWASNSTVTGRVHHREHRAMLWSLRRETHFDTEVTNDEEEQP